MRGQEEGFTACGGTHIRGGILTEVVGPVFL